MSNFTDWTEHPETKIVQSAEWLDDYFGKHRYGVRFADGKVFPEEQCRRAFQTETGPGDRANDSNSG